MSGRQQYTSFVKEHARKSNLTYMDAVKDVSAKGLWAGKPRAKTAPNVLEGHDEFIRTAKSKSQISALSRKGDTLKAELVHAKIAKMQESKKKKEIDKEYKQLNRDIEQNEAAWERTVQKLKNENNHLVDEIKQLNHDVSENEKTWERSVQKLKDENAHLTEELLLCQSHQPIKLGKVVSQRNALKESRPVMEQHISGKAEHGQLGQMFAEPLQESSRQKKKKKKALIEHVKYMNPLTPHVKKGHFKKSAIMEEMFAPHLKNKAEHYKKWQELGLWK